MYKVVIGGVIGVRGMCWTGGGVKRIGSSVRKGKGCTIICILNTRDNIHSYTIGNDLGGRLEYLNTDHWASL